MVPRHWLWLAKLVVSQCVLTHRQISDRPTLKTQRILRRANDPPKKSALPSRFCDVTYLADRALKSYEFHTNSSWPSALNRLARWARNHNVTDSRVVAIPRRTQIIWVVLGAQKNTKWLVTISYPTEDRGTDHPDALSAAISLSFQFFGTQENPGHADRIRNPVLYLPSVDVPARSESTLPGGRLIEMRSCSGQVQFISIISPELGSDTTRREHCPGVQNVAVQLFVHTYFAEPDSILVAEGPTEF
mmetsp:Transcript_39729/g.158062  ORF Transcript_39729/g.158062 Transcript_39729/m.158062 type:complete len:246 (+) Transcript_39729:729-1466(+)